MLSIICICHIIAVLGVVDGLSPKTRTTDSPASRLFPSSSLSAPTHDPTPLIKRPVFSLSILHNILQRKLAIIGMSNAVTSVIIAAASAVAKVFVIGGIGYVCAIRPKPVPILPPHAMNALSTMNFNLLILPLVYSTLASAVTPQTLGSLWFVAVAGVGVIIISYVVATLLGRLPFFRVENKVDFDALRVAAAFPNIVALPILIFPTLCEFSVVYDAFYEGDIQDATGAQKYKFCVDQSNAMIFVYFFAFNLLYWILGYPTLVAAGQKRQNEKELSVTQPDALGETTIKTLGETTTKSELQPEDVIDNEDGHGHVERMSVPKNDDLAEDTSRNEQQIQPMNKAKEGIKYYIRLFSNAFIQTTKSPGFIAMVLGFVTGCIPPLKDALFSPGGALRFLGSALQSLGIASSSVGTLLVAACLVHQATDDSEDENGAETALDNTQEALNSSESAAAELGEADPRDRRSSMRKRRSSISQMSRKAMAAIRRRKPTIKMHSWFIVSRLIVAPAVVSASIIAMDCGGVLEGIPRLAKMVVIVNSCLPGAQLIIVTLRSRGLSDSASIVAKVYLPSYLLSIVTIAGWTSLGLMISIPGENGTSFCAR